MLMVPVAKYSEKISGCPDKHAHKRTVKKKAFCIGPSLNVTILVQHLSKRKKLQYLKEQLINAEPQIP